MLHCEKVGMRTENQASTTTLTHSRNRLISAEDEALLVPEVEEELCCCFIVSFENMRTCL